jgi:hypothetical protein
VGELGYLPANSAITQNGQSSAFQISYLHSIALGPPVISHQCRELREGFGQRQEVSKRSFGNSSGVGTWGNDDRDSAGMRLLNVYFFDTDTGASQGPKQGHRIQESCIHGDMGANNRSHRHSQIGWPRVGNETRVAAKNGIHNACLNRA